MMMSRNTTRTAKRLVRATVCTLAVALGANACVGRIGDGNVDGDVGGDGDGTGNTPMGELSDAEATQVVRIPHAVYRYALVDVFGLDLASVESLALPMDEVVHGFANHNDLRAAAPQAQAYFALAEAVAEMVLADGTFLAGFQSACADADCLERFIGEYGRRLFARALPDSEIAALSGLVVRLRSTLPERSGLDADLRLAATILLQSPHFLFRMEVSGEDDDAEEVRRSGAEIARLLAWTLWLSVPDDELLDAADAGTLDDTEGVDAAIARMLEHAKATRSMVDFVDRTLVSDRFEEISRTDYDITPELRQAWVAEVRAFTTNVVFENDGTYGDLLLSRHTYVNRHNAWIYGVESSSEELKRIELDDRYAGLLTMSGWLASLAKPAETHPIVRGARILDAYLCTELAPVSLDEDDLAAFQGDTVRERVESGTGNASCQGCHVNINPLGFAFEGFNEVGFPQTMDNGFPVDTTGTLSWDGGDDVSIDGPRSVAKFLVQSEAGRACFAERMLTHARGYVPGADDPLLAEVEKMGDVSIKSLLAAIARTAVSRRLVVGREAIDTCM